MSVAVANGKYPHRSETCELICVPPDQAASMWPHVEAFIAEALQTGLSDDSLDDVRRSVLGGQSILWIIWGDENRLMCAGTTLIRQTARGKICIMTTLAGREMGRWRELGPVVEKYAKEEGCAFMRLYGRAGWARVLPDYDESWRVLEKRL